MKTKEEIENLAEKAIPLSNENIDYVEFANHDRKHWVSGYIQCQKDMADKIKKAIEYGYQLRNNHKPVNSGIDWVEEFNRLNKQY